MIVVPNHHPGFLLTEHLYNKGNILSLLSAGKNIFAFQHKYAGEVKKLPKCFILMYCIKQAYIQYISRDLTLHWFLGGGMSKPLIWEVAITCLYLMFMAVIAKTYKIQGFKMYLFILIMPWGKRGQKKTSRAGAELGQAHPRLRFPKLVKLA